MSKVRIAPRVLEWVYHPLFNKVYAYVDYDFQLYRGPKAPAVVRVEDVGEFVTTGRVGEADAPWVGALFYRKGFELDGRSSLRDISDGMFKRKTLIEMSLRK